MFLIRITVMQKMGAPRTLAWKNYTFGAKRCIPNKAYKILYFQNGFSLKTSTWVDKIHRPPFLMCLLYSGFPGHPKNSK